MTKIEKCPECGSRRLGAGRLDGYGSMYASAFKSSPVDAVVCSDCGLVIQLRVRKPQVFAPKIK